MHLVNLIINLKLNSHFLVQSIYLSNFSDFKFDCVHVQTFLCENSKERFVPVVLPAVHIQKNCQSVIIQLFLSLSLIHAKHLSHYIHVLLPSLVPSFLIQLFIFELTTIKDPFLAIIYDLEWRSLHADFLHVSALAHYLLNLVLAEVSESPSEVVL